MKNLYEFIPSVPSVLILRAFYFYFSLFVCLWLLLLLLLLFLFAFYFVLFSLFVCFLSLAEAGKC